MYFKDKNNTNIDNEFDDGNILSKILNILSKYKLIIIIALILIFIIVFILLFTNRKVTNYLDLEGEEYITIYQNEDYIEPGYDAYNSKKQKLNSQVEVITNIDTSKIGEYEITYSLGEIKKTRKVKVITKPKEYTYIYLNSVNDSINVYLEVGEEYIEPGYKVYSTTGKDYTSEVKVTGEVDTNKKGSYQLVYSLIDEKGVTISETRTVIVMDSEIGLFLSTKEYTNKEITISVNVIDNYFEYLILPNGSKVTKSTYEYTVNKNGTYTFKTINKKGKTKEASIEVTNIDKTGPTGTCTGKYGNGKTVLTVNAQDVSGIRKYIIDNKSYMKSPITLYEEKKSINVTIEDKVGNTKTISCNITKENTVNQPSSSSSSSKPSSSSQSSTKPTDKPITSDKSITFSYEYKKEDGYLPYALYTPSTAKQSNKKIPLIIWLHGSVEVSGSEASLKNSGMLKIINNWELEGFNAYVLCPHLTGAYAHTWNNELSRERLNNLTNKIIKEKNIDTSKIIITGHSLGGQGTLYMAAKNDYYYKMVVYSGYHPGISMDGIKIPAKGYVGSNGEDQNSINNMKRYFVPVFGEENLITLNTSHAGVPQVALNLDGNKDNKSDLIEWMLS